MNKSEPLARNYYNLGFADCRKKKYPLWSVLLIAGENVAAAAYYSGWSDAGGCNLRFFRDGSRR